MIKIKFEYRKITYLLPHIKNDFNNRKINNFPCQYSTSSLENANLTSNEFNFENLEEQSIFYKGYFKSVQNQRDFMENLFIKFELKTMNDWLQIEISKIIQNGGVNLIKEYKKDMKLLFSSLYPNFPWDFSSYNLNKQKIKFKSINVGIKNQKNQNLKLKLIEKHRKKMDEIFQKLELKSHDDWFNIPRKKIIKNGGKRLLYRYYKGDLFLLLTTIYPDYSFTLPIIKIQSNEELLIKQREIMDQLFIKLNLNSIEDWLNIPRGKIIKNGGRNLLNYYKGDFSLLLQSIYPYYPINNFKLLLKFKSHHYFQSIENQREFMDYLFKKLKLKSFDNWVKISRAKLQEKGGFSLLSQYNNNMKNILTIIYPNYPWEKLFFIKENIKKNIQLNNQSIDKIRKKIDKIFKKLKLKSIEDWLNISLKKIEKKGGEIFLNYLNNENFNGDIFKFLKRIYPNFPVEFQLLNKKKQKEYFKLIENQQKFMDDLFIKLKLNSFDDWFNIKRKIIKENGGKYLLLEYNKDKKFLLSSIYLNYPWNNFNNNLLNKKNEKIQLINEKLNIKKLKLINEHKEFADKLFIQFNLNSLEDWLKIPLSKLKRNLFFIKYYKKDLNNFLSIIYPNYPWNFNSIKLNENIKKKKKEFFDKLFIKFNLNSLDELLKISKKEIIENGGGNLILKEYKKDNLKFFFSSLYPNFPWEFSHQVKNNIKRKKKYLKLKSIEEQRKRMDEIFQKLKLKSHDDWFNIPRKKIIKNGGKKLLYRYYKGDLFQLLTTIYPFHSFSSNNDKKINRKLYLIEDQIKFMDNLFIKLNLKSIDDWGFISKNLIRENGGLSLLRFYKGNFTLLLHTIYPNFPMENIDKELKLKLKLNYFKSIENQKEFLDNLFIKFNLKSFDNWRKITRKNIRENGGYSLLSQYKNDNMKKILTSIYPNYPWENSIFNFRYNLSPKIKGWIDKYHITQKKDWYRVSSDSNIKNDIYYSLKEFFPSENWQKSNFEIDSRRKKSSQRLLFSFTQKIYPSLLIFEDYFHPQFLHTNNNNYELDIFIPSLQLAMEYQGEQHYDDIPRAFASSELFQYLDQFKEKLAKDHSIKIIYIPYWWDRSLSSLQSSLPRSAVQSNIP